MKKLWKQIKQKYKKKDKNLSEDTKITGETKIIDEKKVDDEKNKNNSDVQIPTSNVPKSDKKVKNGKHLIVDDSDPNRMVLSKYLSRKGYVVEEAINGLDAIETIAKNGEYFIVWMDIMMPRMNGMDCTEALRSKHNYKGVIIGLTGFIDQESINECYKRGMTHVIGKPIDKNVLYHYAEKYTVP